MLFVEMRRNDSGLVAHFTVLLNKLTNCSSLRNRMVGGGRQLKYKSFYTTLFERKEGSEI